MVIRVYLPRFYVRPHPPNRPCIGVLVEQRDQRNVRNTLRRYKTVPNEVPMGLSNSMHRCETMSHGCKAPALQTAHSSTVVVSRDQRNVRSTLHRPNLMTDSIVPHGIASHACPHGIAWHFVPTQHFTCLHGIALRARPHGVAYTHTCLHGRWLLLGCYPIVSLCEHAAREIW